MTRRRQKRAQRTDGGLTYEQRMELVYDIGDGGFASLAEMRAAWFKHRERLLAVYLPGFRPAAFFRFELGAFAPWWPDQITVLMHYGLIDAAEAFAIENSARFPLLKPDRPLPATFDQRFHRTDSDLSTCILQWPSGTIPTSAIFELQREAHEYSVAGDWHEWRNRPERAAECRARAARILEVLKLYLEEGENNGNENETAA